MKKEQLIEAFVTLGHLMSSLANQDMEGVSHLLSKAEFEDFQSLILKQKQKNGWFTEDAVRQVLLALGTQLQKAELEAWSSQYTFTNEAKRVAVIMAGNIPLVGFHDFLCVLMSGNKVICKLSSDDQTLLPALAQILIKIEPQLEERIAFSFGRLGEMDAVIATGSDNSKLYFEQYFGKYPHVFRSNRTSLAVLTGDESDEELQALGKDIFTYFGLGCRNVSHLLLPKGFNIHRVFENLVGFGELINHHKYANNYDYNRAVFMLNKVPFLDNNVVLLREHEDLFSPLAVVHYQYYDNEQQVKDFIDRHKDKIQALVGKNFIPFGEAQSPGLADYADNVDTMEFLNSL